MEAKVFSSYTNAYAIYLGARHFGISLSCTDEYPIFPIPSSSNQTTSMDWLFFTEESSLQRALKGEIEGQFWPRVFPAGLLDDKWALADWLKLRPVLTQGLCQWQLDDIDQIEYPCLLKSKHSWREGVQLPRGWVCRSRREIELRLEEIVQFDDWNNIFFFQEWLGDVNCRVISVCGFHDTQNAERNLTAVVERIAAHSEGLSCSAAIQSRDDTWQLRKKTEEILNELSFTGPFEMEYLVIDEDFFVLELNPRFWMQHSIFLKKGNGLVKRYLGLDTVQDQRERHINGIVWVDSIHLLVSLSRLQFRFFLLVIKKFFEPGVSTVIWPSLPVAMRVYSRMAVRKIKSKLYGAN